MLSWRNLSLDLFSSSRCHLQFAQFFLLFPVSHFLKLQLQQTEFYWSCLLQISLLLLSIVLQFLLLFLFHNLVLLLLPPLPRMSYSELGLQLSKEECSRWQLNFATFPFS